MFIQQFSCLGPWTLCVRHWLKQGYSTYMNIYITYWGSCKNDFELMRNRDNYILLYKHWIHSVPIKVVYTASNQKSIIQNKWDWLEWQKLIHPVNSLPYLQYKSFDCKGKFIIYNFNFLVISWFKMSTTLAILFAYFLIQSVCQGILDIDFLKIIFAKPGMYCIAWKVLRKNMTFPMGALKEMFAIIRTWLIIVRKRLPEKVWH